MICTLSVKEETPSVLMRVIYANYQKALEKYPFLKDYTVPYLVDSYSIATDDLKAILAECGFESVVIESKNMKFESPTKDVYRAWQRPLFMATPFAKIIGENTSQEELEAAFTEFVDTLWQAFEKNDTGGAFYPLSTSVVIAQKPA